MKNTSNTIEKRIELFREKFTVFDGHQNIVKHVTYSSWVERFLKESMEQVYEVGYRDGTAKEAERHESMVTLVHEMKNTLDELKELKPNGE